MRFMDVLLSLRARSAALTHAGQVLGPAGHGVRNKKGDPVEVQEEIPGLAGDAA
jgi:hypothetical protein